MLTNILEMSIVLFEEEEAMQKAAASSSSSSSSQRVPAPPSLPDPRLLDPDLDLKNAVSGLLSKATAPPSAGIKRSRSPSGPAASSKPKQRPRCPIDVQPGRERAQRRGGIHVVDPSLDLYLVAAEVLAPRIEENRRKRFVLYVPTGHARLAVRDFGGELRECVTILSDLHVYRDQENLEKMIAGADCLAFMQPNLCGSRAVRAVLQVLNRMDSQPPRETACFCYAFHGRGPGSGSGSFCDFSDLSSLVVRNEWGKRETWDRKFFDYREVAAWMSENVTYHAGGHPSGGLGPDEAEAASQPAHVTMPFRTRLRCPLGASLERIHKGLEACLSSDKEVRFLEVVEQAAADLEREIVLHAWLPTFAAHLKARAAGIRGMTAVVVCADRRIVQDVVDHLSASPAVSQLGADVFSLVKPEDACVFQLRDCHRPESACEEGGRGATAFLVLSDREFETHARSIVVDKDARVARVYCAKMERRAESRVVDLAAAYFRGRPVEIVSSSSEGRRGGALELAGTNPFYENTSLYKMCGILISACEGARGGIFTDVIAEDKDRRELAIERLSSLFHVARRLVRRG